MFVFTQEIAIDSRQQRGEGGHKLTSHDIELASNELLYAAEQANWGAVRDTHKGPAGSSEW